MKVVATRLQANSSGQLLIVAALAIALLISSTTIYVYELSKETNSADVPPNDSSVLALKQSTRNAVISSLANASNGGFSTILVSNLNELSQVLRNRSYLGISNLAFTALDNSNYDSGIWLSWGSNGAGVSSAYADFNLTVYGTASSAINSFEVNATTAITLNGFYTLVGTQNNVNLTLRTYNEGKPALLKNVSIFYQGLVDWTVADESNNLSVRDYGNGTYTVSFIVDSTLLTVNVSVHVYDSRSVFVQANATCPLRLNLP